MKRALFFLAVLVTAILLINFCLRYESRGVAAPVVVEGKSSSDILVPPTKQQGQQEKPLEAILSASDQAKAKLLNAMKKIDYARGVTLRMEQQGGNPQILQMKTIDGVVCSRLETVIGGHPATLLQNDEGFWMIVDKTALKVEFAAQALSKSINDFAGKGFADVDPDSSYSEKNTYAESGASSVRISEEYGEKKLAQLISAFSQGGSGTAEQRASFAQNHFPASVEYDIDQKTGQIISEKRFNLNGQPVGPTKRYEQAGETPLPDTLFYPEPGTPRTVIKSLADFQSFRVGK